MSEELPVLVAIATPHAGLNKGIAERVRAEPAMYVMAATASSRLLLRIAEEIQPDAVVVDERLSTMTRRDLIAEVHARSPSSGILALLPNPDRVACLRAHAAGALGFASPAVTLDALVGGIHVVVNGGGWLERALLADAPEDLQDVAFASLIAECREWMKPRPIRPALHLLRPSS